MKKTILLVLMAVILATPCFAQEVEPEGIFTIGGTIWEAFPMGIQIFPFPSRQPIHYSEFGFYGGKVYPWISHDSFYIDMLVCSIFWVDVTTKGSLTLTWAFGILHPIGIGIVGELHGPNYNSLPSLTIGLLIKTDNNWTPSDIE